MKIAIIGIGHVGSALAYALVLKGLGEHLVLANRDVTKAQGDALDLRHTLAFCERSMQVESRAIEQVRACDILAVTVSVPLGGPMSQRMELGPANVALFRQLVPLLARNNPQAIFIVISNPVDILTYLAQQLSGFPASRVVGVGTLVDSARFRALLSAQEQIHPHDLRAYILGEHGPDQFPVFSQASAGSERIADNLAHRQLFNAVSNAGFEILKLKGYTNYAVAAAACEVVRAIVHDTHATMPLSTCFTEWQGIADNCFSIPVVVGRAGVIRHLHPELNRTERKALEKTAMIVKAHRGKLLGPDTAR